ncbi:MAG: 2Fe-2S iron-sulfur cluster binding domain-containing protein [Helicobacteraceae bacterium]|nr:2Fe-2S iron-sulfur cluster binding domain-containing protein [Helicobacteraceae bacterium]
MSKQINFTIDGRSVECQSGESILDVARREGFYIPTMCYLAKATPNASCRMCVVEVEGVDGLVLSCNTPAIEGASITTESDILYKERQNIMKLYNVNHPLQCGVCDKSGECDLQNKTTEFDLAEQTFATQEQKRKKKKWGVLSYDPYLCIMCEKCTSVCNEVVGSEALYIKPGGYKSVIDNHFGDCIQCGECISVCPVGAMASSDFKYNSNAWELQKVPSACAHCSSACNLEYEVKHSGIDSSGSSEIYRVTNEDDFDSLCGAGRFGYDYENRVAIKDEKAFNSAVEAFKNADTIKFNSMITNEEALILQRLKDKNGYRLVNEEARNYQNFMNSYSSVSGTSLYSGDLQAIKDSDYVITLGSSVSRDNPMIRFALATAVNINRANVAYLHPIEDYKLENLVTQFIRYEVGSEEGVMAMLLEAFASDEAKEEQKAFFSELDMGYISGESNVNEDEIKNLKSKMLRKKSPVIVIGADVMAHPSSSNIAKMVALLEKSSEFKVVIIPTNTNTLGVSMICDLDSEEGSSVVGYNVHAATTLCALGDGDLDMPALNQQEGTFTSIDKRVVPLNAALPHAGYELNDIAIALGVESEETINYTSELPTSKGFKSVEFDSLENYYTNGGEAIRGYLLDNKKIKTKKADEAISNITELEDYNGSVIYSVDHISQFNTFTNKTHQIIDKANLIGSEQFAMAAKIKGGQKVKFMFNGKEITRVFNLDSHLKGTVARHSTFDLHDSTSSGKYRYTKVQIQEEGN